MSIRKIVAFCVFLCILMRLAPLNIAPPTQGSSSRQAESFKLAFSTYCGGSNWEHFRDTYVDDHGNVYITGGSGSDDFPTTPGAYDRVFDFGGSDLGGAGPCDVVVAKFDANGSLIWSTYIGGKNYDRGYAIEVDDQGYVYVAGRAGQGFPVTAGAFQTTYQGVWGNFYGGQNGFVAKLLPDGSDLVWASYVGVGSLCRDMAIDDDGDVYVPLVYDGTGGMPPASWLTNAYQKTAMG